MIDINIIRTNRKLVEDNLKKKYQEAKLPVLDEIIELDKKVRELKINGDNLRQERNKTSDEIGLLYREKKIEEANSKKDRVKEINVELIDIEKEEEALSLQLKQLMMTIPQIIDDSVPIGENDTQNVELEKFGEPLVPNYEIPYHADILESINGLDKDASGRTSGNGFYYLMGDAARLSSAMLSYARDFMIDKGFTYCIPPFMIRSNVVTGVMSFDEMEAMMYKIEGEDLYLIGTSEHSMIGKFIDTINPKDKLPYTLTSYSPCFRKEKGEPEDSMSWFEKMYQYTVELFVSMGVPVRTLECCSGDLADLKVKSIDVEAWSPRQQKYFEVGSCSNLGDAQARRLGIRIKGENGNYFAHTLNNTVVAPPRMLIALLENHLQADGSIIVPEVLRPYMGGLEVIKPIK